MNWIIETQRIGFRKITTEDFKDLCVFLQDIEVMYAWEHEFTDEEVREWINKNVMRYEKDGFSYLVMIDKEINQTIGVMGPLVEEIEGKAYIGIAYILNKKFWGKGYAVEGAKTCVDYAFRNLGADKVIAEIRPNNIGSRKVAEKLGMTIEGEFVKEYQGKEIVHLIYSIERTDEKNNFK